MIVSPSFIRHTRIVSNLNVYSCLNLIDFKNKYSDLFEQLNYPDKNDGLLTLFAFYMERYGLEKSGLNVTDLMEQMEYYASLEMEKYQTRNYYKKLKDDNPDAIRYIYAFEKILKTTAIVYNSGKEIMNESVIDIKYMINMPTFLYHHGIFMRIAYYNNVATDYFKTKRNILKCHVVENHFNENYPIKDAFTYIENSYIAKKREDEDIFNDFTDKSNANKNKGIWNSIYSYIS